MGGITFFFSMALGDVFIYLHLLGEERIKVKCTYNK